MYVVGVASANRPEAIKRLLPSLREQTIYGKGARVVVFNGTKKNNIEVYKEYVDLDKANDDVKFIHQEGGPALGRNLLRGECDDDEVFILLDDDTFPKEKNTLEKLVGLLEKENVDIVSGVWECEKQKYRPYGEVIEIAEGVANRKPLREKGVHDIHIPLATLAAKGSNLKKVSFDPKIDFYGDMYDIGMSILKNKLSCRYSSDVVFEHKNIPNDKRVDFKRPAGQWGYLADKWRVSFFVSGDLYTPRREGGDNKKVFMVEFNKYHFETLPAYVEVFSDLGCEVEVLINNNRLGVDEDVKRICRNVVVTHFDSTSEALDILESTAKQGDYCFLNSSGFMDNSLGGSGSKIYNTKYVDEVLNTGVFQSGNIIAVHHDALKISSHDLRGVAQLCIQPVMAKINNFYYIPPVSLKKPCRDFDKVFKKFIVPGLVEESRRDYEYIEHSFSSAVKDVESNEFFLDICGAVPASSQGYMKSIIDRAKQKGTDSFFVFPELKGAKVVNKKFEEKLNSSDFLVLGTDPYNKEHSKYLRNKGSGAFGLVLDYNLIPVCHKYFAIAYGLQNVAITYGDESSTLKDAMLKCMKMNGEEVRELRSKILVLKQSIYNENKAKLSRVLSL